MEIEYLPEIYYHEQVNERISVIDKTCSKLWPILRVEEFDSFEEKTAIKIRK